MIDISSLQARISEFAQRRDWEQFHNPKNLAMALSAEVGELVEIFQWLTLEQAASVMADADTAAAVMDECADVLIYLARLADVLGLDLLAAANAKIDRNEVRFPYSG